MAKQNMNCLIELNGDLCGIDTTLCGGYVDDEFLVSSTIIIDRDGLCNLIKVLGSLCKQEVEPFVQMLEDFRAEISFNYTQSHTVLLLNSDAVKFVGYDGEGKLVAFNISPREMINGQNNSLADIIRKTVTYFGIKDFTFLYRSNNITNNAIYESFSFLPQMPYVIKDAVVICGRFDFGTVSESLFTKGMKELFGINSMEVYLGAGKSDISCALVIPDVQTSILSCRNIILYANMGSSGVIFSMEGSLSLNCFSGMEFYIKCQLSLTGISISASSQTTNTYTIPSTALTICNSGLAIGYDDKGLNFAIMTQVNVRNLMWYGALRLSYQGSVVVPDMMSMAMSEVSLAALAENLIGLSSDKVESLDAIAILPFDLQLAQKNTKVDFRNKTDAEIISMVNAMLKGMKEEFLLSQDSTSITRMPSGKACDILNEETMFHYWINDAGELSFPPQAYYSASHISIGKYNFEKGVFFCGKVNLFGYGIKIMFSALYQNGFIGYAQIGEINTRFMKVSGSVSSRSMKNPVLGNGTNSTLALLAGDFSLDKTIENPAIIYMSVSRNSCEFYIDAHFELCSVFSFDTLMYYVNRHIHISTTISYFNMISASIYLDVLYEKFTSACFDFALSLDCTGLHDKLTNLTKTIDNAVALYDKKITDAKQKITAAKNKVCALQNDINGYQKKIEICKKTINNTPKRKRWYVAICEGTKIAAYEALIYGLKASMKIAEGALNVAEKVLDLGGKIGTDVLNAVNAVIRGALDAFYLNSAVLQIMINGDVRMVKAGVDMHVLGKDINVNYECNLDDLIKKPIALLEEQILKQLSDLINSLRSGEYVYAEIQQADTYPYMDETEDLLEISKMASTGMTRMVNYRKMVDELSEVYINEMKDTAPDFEDCDTQIRETLLQMAYVMDKAADNTCLDGMDELLAMLNDRMDTFNEQEKDTVQECIDVYTKELRAANSIVSEAAMQLQIQTQDMDADNSKQYLRRMRSETENYTGTEILESKDYDKLYNRMEAVVTYYFPPGTGEGYFNFTDEEKFYEMLNDAREAAGCTYIPANVSQENDTLCLGGLRTQKAADYIPRL